MPGTSTLLLDAVAWDLILDADGNIALASDPYSLAQDAASAIRTFLGEVYWNTLTGVDYFGEILGRNPPLALLKARFQSAAESVLGVGSAKVFISAITERSVSGQVQVTSSVTGLSSAANFSSVNPQVA